MRNLSRSSNAAEEQGHLGGRRPTTNDRRVREHGPMKRLLEQRRLRPQRLSQLYTGRDAWPRLVLSELPRKVVGVGRIKALGFCLDVADAEF